MSAQTDYTRLAGQIDYPAVIKRLEQLRDQEPPHRRKRAADVLAPMRDKLMELRARGWTFTQLVGELKSAGLPVGRGTLRRYLGGTAKHRAGANRRRTVGG